MRVFVLSHLEENPIHRQRGGVESEEDLCVVRQKEWGRWEGQKMEEGIPANGKKSRNIPKFEK